MKLPSRFDMTITQADFRRLLPALREHAMQHKRPPTGRELLRLLRGEILTVSLTEGVAA